MENRLVVFFCRHQIYDCVEIKGVFDVDFFEEPGAVQYFDSNKELHKWIPVNPYDVDDQYELWAAYKDLTNSILSDKELEELLYDCIEGIEKYHRKGYDIEMEALQWQTKIN